MWDLRFYHRRTGQQHETVLSFFKKFRLWRAFHYIYDDALPLVEWRAQN